MSDSNESGSQGTDGEGPARRLRPCPVCAKMSTPADHPFCSDRCAKVDLNRWLSGGYGIPVVEFDDLSEGDDQS
ncbi:MAG: DNA gyrase inhibitor YacG [Pannonibacter sp.]